MMDPSSNWHMKSCCHDDPLDQMLHQSKNVDTDYKSWNIKEETNWDP